MTNLASNLVTTAQAHPDKLTYNHHWDPRNGEQGLRQLRVGLEYLTRGTGLGWVDVGRRWAGEVDGPYSWWSNRGKAFDTDTGWRIDYHLATPSMAERVVDYRVVRAPSWDTRWSDHAPVVADYAF